MTADAESKAGNLRFLRVELRAFRNLEQVGFEPAPKLNVVYGDNGQGKTSLLEALYFVATTRSFRSERLQTLIREGQASLLVRAELEETGYRREQRATLSAAGRRVSIDGKKPDRLLDYALRTPVVAFHPNDLGLVSGPAAPRRRLLDRVALFVDPSGFERRFPFERALKERQRTLAERGARAPELEAYELLIAEHGARYQAARALAAQELLTALSSAFGDLGAASQKLVAGYLPGGSTDVSTVRRELFARRGVDRIRRAPTYGPSRDDLEFALSGRSARRHASQGQQRLLTLALKLAELECISQARGVLPVLLLDDVSSELDRSRTGAVYDVLRTSAGQVFVTTTRPELFPSRSENADERVDFRIDQGVLERR